MDWSDRAVVSALSTVTKARAACKVTEEDAGVGAENTLNRMTFERCVSDLNS
jgi:hypothetical protein